MLNTYDQGTITLDTAYGTFDDVPAVVQYSASLQPKDPSVGELWDQWVAEASVVSVKVEDLTLSRDQLVGMLGKSEVERQEELIGEKIASELDCGDLSYFPMAAE